MESILIPCVKWTKKGFASAEGKQIEMNPEEIKEILKRKQFFYFLSNLFF